MDNSKLKVSGQGKDASLTPISLTSFNLTEYGNAERLVEQFGHLFRYCPTLGWLTWQTNHWQVDISGEIERFAKETVRNIYHEAGNCQDGQIRSKLGKHAITSEKRQSIRNMIELAQTEISVVVESHELDHDPWLFNVANGTLNLKTLKLQPHDPAQLLTKISHVVYDPEATHWAVDDLIALFAQDGRADCLQRSFGSCLFGEAPNERLWYLVGEAGTGKSTFIEAVASVLGDYAITIDAALIVASDSQKAAGPRPELLNLMGARMVIAKEIPKNARLNGQDVKALTGRDTVSARALYSNHIMEFKPNFKMFVHSNYDVRVDWDDSGVKRRLLRIPFHAKPTIPDPDFKRILQHDPKAQSALLNWLLKGYVLWRDSKYDLGISEEIQAFTSDLWKESDPFYGFAEQRLSFDDPEAVTPFKTIWQAYQDWCQEYGTKPRSQTELGTWFSKKGCVAKQHRMREEGNVRKNVRARMGVHLIS